MLICLYLPQQFGIVAAYRWGEHFHRLYDAVGIDQKATTHVHAGIFAINTIQLTQFSALV